MSINTKLPETATSNHHKLPIKPEILLSLATGPFLLGLVTVRSCGSLLGELGQATEEVFRGERLPVLHFPHTKTEE